MKLQFKSVAIGFILACVLLVGAFFGFFYLEGGSRPLFHDQVLASGKTIKVASFYLVWGVEHDERRTGDDSFQLEYVSSFANADQQARDLETLEVFELIRIASEQWGFAKATVSAFPTTERKGKYDIYAFSRASDGRWSFNRTQAKVFANN
jgi:hypothetical protein